VARLLPLVAALFFTSTLQAQEKKPLSGDEMIDRFLAARTDKLSKKFLDGARTLKKWQAERPRLQRELMDMLGLWPLPEKAPLKATVTGALEHEGIVIEKLHFQSIPGLYVTANFYTPKARRGRKPPEKLPTILYVCGHSGRGRDGVKTAYQDHGMWFASNGYNCLIVDTLQLGEIAGIHHGTYKFERWWWHSTGYTPAGVECWNGIRAIDYLLTRADVDPDRIGVTGISGGGASTVWIAAADERVKVAVPVSGMSDLASYVKNKVINGHCDCMFVYNTYQWDWATIAALMAPRPLLFANSDNDPIFPMDGNRRIIEKLHMIYSKYGKADLVEEYVSKGGHAYRPDLRVAVFRFFNQHLKGDVKTPVKDAAFEKIPGKALRVFPSDDDLPKDSINHKVDEVFVPRANVKLPAKDGFAAWRKDMLARLKERSFRAVAEPVEDMAGEGDDGSLVGTGGSGPLIYMEKADFEKLPDYRQFSKLFMRKGKGNAALVYFPRIVPLPTASGSIRLDDFFHWTKKSPPNYVERAHLLLGHTLDERRLHPLLVTVRKLGKGEGPPRWDGRIVAKGQAAVIAAYAAFLEPGIEELILIDPPKTHKAGPHFLGVQRVLDVPDALGLLAPVRLTILGGAEAAFERTEEIYRLAGAAEKLTRK
jgi:dienelactone hydrolase